MSTRTTANRGPLPALLRLVVTVQAVAVFVQAVTAGLLLSVPAGKPLHSAGAYTLFVVAMLHVPVAVLAWRPGGGSPRAILFAVVFLAVALVQVMLGIAHLTALHVPLGVLMFGGSVVQVVTVWTRRRAAAPVPA